ncbi:MAG: 2-hydroxyacyl-CoA dehydratase, partial [Clostridia bacterium]|nr:2-hydroxyacyl-CoA dehydratase [Clostridia bacterium]
VPEYRHRAIIWGVQSQYYTDFLPWLQNCWGILPLVDMLSLVYFDEVSEDDPEQAIYDIAKLYQEMIMRNRTHGGYEVLLDDLWRFCEYYNADMVILWEHITCKALDGMHGLFEERARENGIKLIWVDHQLMDPRVIPRQGVRDAVNRYMRAVLQEEPLDPSLEVLDDEQAW